jgi:O-acetyl-ADP-ribose deacetylase (regulator of RNase III)
MAHLVRVIGEGPADDTVLACCLRESTSSIAMPGSSQHGAERHHGELHVGGAELVETGDDRWPILVFAPTMRVPDDVSRTTNAYVAFRAILLAVVRHNASGAKAIRSLLCPGLCTGVGAMPARRCAAQMRIAYRQVREPPTLPAFETIYETHTKMRTVT